MFLLLLMGLGAESVKAQVRIGGDGAPNPAAILDLNATDATTGTKGLALPRVSLTDVNTPLTGSLVVNGMMVYNTNSATTGGTGAGIYCWDGKTWRAVRLSGEQPAYTLNLVFDTTVTKTTTSTLTYVAIPTAVTHSSDLCTSSVGWCGFAYTGDLIVLFYQPSAYTFRVRCYRPTI